MRNDRADSPHIGQDSGNVAGLALNGVLLGAHQAVCLKADVVIDFSAPDASTHHAALAAETGKAMVIGTTGLTPEQEDMLRQAAKQTAIVYCANTSVGVTLLTQLVQQVAAQLTTDWDIEILETHHHHKVDALGNRAGTWQSRRCGMTGRLRLCCRHGAQRQTGARTAGDIGFAVLRGGDVVGEHSVIFYGESERVEIIHRANDRVIFAWALRAANLPRRQPGFYDMHDVLKG